MARLNKVQKAEKDYQVIRLQHEKLKTDRDAQLNQVKEMRSSLGDRVLAGEELKEMTQEIAKAEGHLAALNAAVEKSSELVEVAGAGVLVARHAKAEEVIKDAYKKFQKVNSSAGELLDGVYLRIEELDNLGKTASEAYAEVVDTLPRTGKKQELDFKVSAVRRAVKSILAETHMLLAKEKLTPLIFLKADKIGLFPSKSEFAILIICLKSLFCVILMPELL